ncbi:unnamed protein product [Pleuronectes platessa]|uniref:Uncharacterized protein n=1 Tax=Pleuronectes platessa TaxID=8262 RepID=A0A9N7Z1J8_PLEPL|nr:unnamed protein product [Pleuronectes platessa]
MNFHQTFSGIVRLDETKRGASGLPGLELEEFLSMETKPLMMVFCSDQIIRRGKLLPEVQQNSGESLEKLNSFDNNTAINLLCPILSVAAETSSESCTCHCAHPAVCVKGKMGSLLFHMSDAIGANCRLKTSSFSRRSIPLDRGEERRRRVEEKSGGEEWRRREEETRGGDERR